MPLVRLGPLSAVPPGTVVEARFGEEVYAVSNVDGEIHVLDGHCPHRGGPLGHGAVHGHMLACPWHAWEFDCRTGAFDRDPEVLVRKHPVTLADGDIFIEIS